MRLIISVLVLAALIGCSNTQNEILVEPVKTTIAIVKAAKPGPVQLKPVEFIVVTKDNSTKMDKERVWYAFTVASYENLAFNIQEMLRVIREQKAAIKYYEGLYVTAN
jgi:hypothetical protein